MNFDEVIKSVFSGVLCICPAEGIHIIFENYKELPVKECEGVCRAGAPGSVALAIRNVAAPITQTKIFWTSSYDKLKLQLLTCDIAKC